MEELQQSGGSVIQKRVVVYGEEGQDQAQARHPRPQSACLVGARRCVCVPSRRPSPQWPHCHSHSRPSCSLQPYSGQQSQQSMPLHPLHQQQQIPAMHLHRSPFFSSPCHSPGSSHFRSSPASSQHGSPMM